MSVAFETIIVDVKGALIAAHSNGSVAEAVKRATQLQLLSTSPRRIEFRARTGWRSGGEWVSIDFEDGAIRIRSTCILPQAIDMGKNAENVDTVREILQDSLSGAP